MSFPIVLSNGPPPTGKAPNGRNGLAEVVDAGVTHVRTGRGDWSGAKIDAQIASERALLDALAARGLQSWCWLGDLANLPETSSSPQAQLLARVADGLQGHAALGAYKGVDEPRNPFRGANWIRPAGLMRAKTKLAQLDPDHPVVIIQAPPSPLADLVPYQGTFDVTGADIFPVSYPPGAHAGAAGT